MNQQSYKKLTSAYRLVRADLFLTLIPAILWIGATYARPSVMNVRCLSQPQTCTKNSVFPIDQLSLGMEDGNADGYSYFTQNLSGVLAFLVPPLWNSALYMTGAFSPMGALVATGTDWVITTQTVTWNGFFTELSHLISQRPRPFVYSDPLQRGTDPAHYTSFYSGHTSFTAAANTALFFVLLSRGAPLFILLISGITLETLLLATAYFRILAGRHFLTDVICGALAGLLIAGTIAFCHARMTKSDSIQEL